LTATLLRILTGVRARFVGFDPETCPPACRIFFANHTSNLDGPTIWASLPRNMRRATRPMAAKDYWSKGPIRRYLALKVFRCVLIERKKVTPSNNPLRDMQAAIDEGASLILFPEGTRGEGGAVGTFKPGLYHLARRCADVELVPVYLENLNRMLPKGEFLFIPLLSTAYFGAPMKLIAGESKEAFLIRAKAAVEALRQIGGCDG
jgi:1-acyl-sn-glycerol-3-phosphate acyltransferase